MPSSENMPGKSALQAEILAEVEALQRKVRSYTQQFNERPTFLLGGPLCRVSQKLVDGCEVLADRQELLRRLAKGGRLVEVGTLYGDFAIEILQTCAPAELHIIDISLINMRAENFEKLQAAGAKFQLGLSWDMLASYPEHYFDMIYIDARHTFDAVTLDIAAAMKALKPDGMLILNDYTLFDPWSFQPYGVVQATNAAAIEYNLRFRYFALQVSGFYDVALVRT